MFVLLTVVSSAITYVPSAQWLGVLFSAGSFVAAVTSAGLAATFGRLPSSHWVHTSRPLFVMSVVAASVVTLLFAVIG